MKPLLLFVDDDMVDVELSWLTLAKAGIHVESRRVIDEAGLAAALAERLPDMVLADICLPQFDAWDARRICQRVCPGVPFVIYSGTVTKETERLAKIEGVLGTAEKDSPREFVKLVRRALGMP